MDRLLRASQLVAVAASVIVLGAFAGCDDGSDERSGRAGAPGSAPDATPNVLIVSIDTLRADHLGSYGYSPYSEPVSPQIDQFAREGVVFERCFAPRGQTGPSLGSMLTGLYPSRHGVLDNFQPLRPEIATIAHHLAAEGYDTRAFVSFLPIGARKERLSGAEKKGQIGVDVGFVQGAASRSLPRGELFEGRPRPARGTTQSSWDDAVEQRFGEFVKSRRRDGPPFLAWLHLYDVHQPYAPPAPYDRKFVGDYRGPLALPPGAGEGAFDAVVKRRPDESMLARAPLAAEDAKYVVALYDGGIAAADARFGRILRMLDDAGVAQKTLVVLTADHGEELGEHHHFWFHGNSVYDSVLRIPLIVRGPGVIPGRKNDLVQNVDLLPTLLDLVDPDDDPRGARDDRRRDVDGISFAPLLHGLACAENGGRTVAWSEWEHLILGARTQRWKFILNPRGARPKKPPYDGADDAGFALGCRELYDVTLDPREQKDLWRERKLPAMAGSIAEIDALRTLVAEQYALRFADLQPQELDAIDDPIERERLRALGYAGAFSLDPGRCDEE